jgi:hypothetical protein
MKYSSTTENEPMTGTRSIDNGCNVSSTLGNLGCGLSLKFFRQLDQILARCLLHLFVNVGNNSSWTLPLLMHELIPQ